MRRALFLVAILTSFAVGCGGPLTYQLASSPKAVGADGTLEATIYKDEHETKLVFNVKNLAPAARINADAKVFVVWGRKDDKTQWQRVGNVVYSEDKRTGVFKASFPETEFDFQVCAEKDEAPVSPSSDVLFSQHVAAK